ncbi:MAG TPA: ATP-binding protein [Candidatus Angelobacter sp.]|jgi:PAS domain S-box-containing protein|nr:ATP-binding protein [Candidatus Angelobacter sp.]
MPALSLKTKLVLSITAMVVAIVATLSTLYISEVVHQRIQEVASIADVIELHMFAVARPALTVDLSSTKIDLNNPEQVDAAMEDLLQGDTVITSLLESVSGDSRNILDACIVDTNGLALLHTNSTLQNTIVPAREDFANLLNGGIRRQFKLIYGPPETYDARLPLLNNVTRKPFGEVRVGISTTLLRDTLRPQITRALLFSGSAILLSLILAAGLSNLALRPLAAISHRLDLISSGKADLVGTPSRRSDEYGMVSTKIERLGRQMRDVKEVFSALKENLDQMMANLQDGVMLFTSDSNAVLVSASAERFIGKPRGEMLGRQPAEIFSRESVLGRAILDAFASRQPVAQDEIEDAQGRHIQLSLDFIEEHGERIGALLTLRDAESVHRIEDEIELSRRLSAIGRLTSGVAHEVKNPINAIVVHLEVLRQKMKEIDPDTRRHVDVISSEIQRLDRVVQTLVDFTRPVELRLSDMDLRKVVEDVVILASPAAEKHNVLIEREAAPDALPVRIDVDLVKQAVLNIVLNGVQAMPQGGTLRLTLSREGDGALISVRDQGAGIPDNIRDKIFNLYFTTKSGGSGIGLAMAYRVVQLHHGSVEFSTTIDHGTTFYLRFPLAETAANGEAPAVAKEDSVSKA